MTSDDLSLDTVYIHVIDTTLIWSIPQTDYSEDGQ